MHLNTYPRHKISDFAKNNTTAANNKVINGSTAPNRGAWHIGTHVFYIKPLSLEQYTPSELREVITEIGKSDEK